MGEFFVSISLISLILGALSFLSYPSGHERSVKCAIMILLLYSVILCGGSLALSLGDGEAWHPIGEVETGIYGDEYERLSRESFSSGIKRALGEKFGIADECVMVYVEGFDSSLMRAKKIEITLTGVGVAADFRGIENYIEENGLGECEVKIYAGKT